MKIKKFRDKSVAIFHGLGGSPAQDRIEYLKSLGYTEIFYDHIDYEKEWSLDKCRSLFYDQIQKVKNVDVIIGFSLGGYLAFQIAGYLSKNMILINPSLDRSKTKLDIKEFDTPNMFNFDFKEIEVFLGENDTTVPKHITLDYLKESNIKFNMEIIKGMEHRTPIEYFEEILNKSRLV